jgi:hypothetical protein
MRRIAKPQARVQALDKKEMKDASTSVGDGEINKSKGKLFL